ncbi:DUF3291 domain-containing protein [Nocardiopsis trehalosi]|jgi:hypothetical protein|uniref:DUF3291 domain-containing protein n=1 Tax=Nocardiopsis trehalosi TaxID=109329 RepID=UPI000A043236|nr:DUF3291 domain-containing protein [Nocardiopsis trehalosi]
MGDHHLAEINIGTLAHPLDHPAMAEFVALLDPINAMAEASPGFVWRFTEDGANDATGLRPFGPDVIVNFSVWESREALWDFTYRSDHLDLLRRRRDWFTHMRDIYLVLWWVPAGHRPDLAEAADRLALLRDRGPTPEAFTFAAPFPPPRAASAPA